MDLAQIPNLLRPADSLGGGPEGNIESLSSGETATIEVGMERGALQSLTNPERSPLCHLRDLNSHQAFVGLSHLKDHT